MNKCTAPNCDNVIKAKKLCSKHYRRINEGKSLDTKLHTDMTVKERLDIKTDFTSSPVGCWLWTGGTRGRKDLQYGVISVKSVNISTHRLAYELANNDLVSYKESKLEVCHTCDNPLCVNPSHLYLGTKSVNMRDKVAKGRCGQKTKTHCPKGHEYSQQNTYVSKSGSRHCRTCHKLNEKIRRKRLKGELLS